MPIVAVNVWVEIYSPAANMNQKSKQIALAAVGCAFSLVMVLMAHFIKNMSLSFNVLAGIGVMLPMSKKYTKTTLLSIGATVVLGFLFVNIGILTFALVGGTYTFLNCLFYNKKIAYKKTILIKIGFAIVTFVILYFVTSLLSFDFSKLPIENTSLLAVILGCVFVGLFIAYDYLLTALYSYMINLFNRIVKF